MTIAHGLPDMEPQAKERLYSLIDRLPEQEIEAAQRYLEFLCQHEDPVIRAMRCAPIDDEPLTDEDLETIEEGRREIAAGRGIPHDEVCRKLGL